MEVNKVKKKEEQKLTTVEKSEEDLKKEIADIRKQLRVKREEGSFKSFYYSVRKELVKIMKSDSDEKERKKVLKEFLTETVSKIKVE